jgi:hypothetical protein
MKARFFLSLLATACIVPAWSQEKALPQLAAKDIVIVPFCSVATDTKLDPKSKDIFDELKVTVTTGKQTRCRISGKKKEESGNLEGRPVLHTGKLALIPADNRKGTLAAKLPTVVDVRSYYICAELADNKLKSEYVKLEKGIDYTWSVETAGDQKTFQLLDLDKKVIATIKAPEKQMRAIGFAATVRWKGNEADLAATVDPGDTTR